MFKHIARSSMLVALVGIIFLGVLSGCGKSDEKNDASNSAKNETNTEASSGSNQTELSGTVTASGSTALLPLVKTAKTEFEDKNPKVTVNVTGGGSGTGLKQVASGEVNIGNSDVEAGDEYKDKNLVDHVVAIAPFAIIVNKEVNIDSLTKQQAADIFTGKIKNWSEVGGSDMPVVIVHRPDASGSRKLVKKIVLDNVEFTKEGVTQESSGAMKTAVSETKGAIGYVDLAYVDDTLKAIKFDGVAYTPEAIKDGSYKLYGIEHMYTQGEADGAVKAFIDYILSAEFQNGQVKEIGFLPADTLGK